MNYPTHLYEALFRNYARFLVVPICGLLFINANVASAKGGGGGGIANGRRGNNNVIADPNKSDLKVQPVWRAEIERARENDKFPSLRAWNTVDREKHFTVTSMIVDHHSDASWYIPSLHDRFSAGWNRSVSRPFHQRPWACNIRFFGIALESTLEQGGGFVRGGTGYLVLKYPQTGLTMGLTPNETNKVHCYYMTNKDYGSEFLTTPKTLGIVAYCPVLLDAEIGEDADTYCYLC